MGASKASSAQQQCGSTSHLTHVSTMTPSGSGSGHSLRKDGRTRTRWPAWKLVTMLASMRTISRLRIRRPETLRSGRTKRKGRIVDLTPSK
eukprot:scaffold3_cov273-Pinguiococcus_pyrenoidosus.AAC.2